MEYTGFSSVPVHSLHIFHILSWYFSYAVQYIKVLVRTNHIDLNVSHVIITYHVIALSVQLVVHVTSLVVGLQYASQLAIPCHVEAIVGGQDD